MIFFSFYMTLLTFLLLGLNLAYISHLMEPSNLDPVFSGDSTLDYRTTNLDSQICSGSVKT